MHHDFCFICLLPWFAAHDCPYYNDSPQGYDQYGFERSERGLHVRTGLDREDRNRFSRHLADPDHNDTSSDTSARSFVDIFEDLHLRELAHQQLAMRNPAEVAARLRQVVEEMDDLSVDESGGT